MTLTGRSNVGRASLLPSRTNGKHSCSRTLADERTRVFQIFGIN